MLTGDALFCQRNICQQVCEAGGDYVILVKANQGTSFNDIRLLCEDPDPAATLTDRREATTVDSGHGRCADTRYLIASTDLVGYLDWPHHTQVFRYERTWTEQGTFHAVVRYGITSLPPQVADAKELLALKRAHWQIDITYVRLTKGWMYLVAILDWFSRYIVAWELDQTLAIDFVLEAVDRALTHAKPVICNSDQGSHFTSPQYLDRLLAHDVRISMDGKGRALDNIFTERLWRTVKYEMVSSQMTSSALFGMATCA